MFLQPFRQRRKRQIAPHRGVDRLFRRQQRRPLIADQDEKTRHILPMRRQRHRRQLFQFRQIGALTLGIVHHLGKAFGQRSGMGKAHLFALRPGPLPDHGSQKQLPPDGRNSGRQFQPVARHLEQKHVLVAVAQCLELRQQRRAAQDARKGLAEISRRAASGKIDGDIGQRERTLPRPLHQPARQGLAEWCRRGDREDAAQLLPSLVRNSSASSRALGLPTCSQAPSSRMP